MFAPSSIESSSRIVESFLENPKKAESLHQVALLLVQMLGKLAYDLRKATFKPLQKPLQVLWKSLEELTQSPEFFYGSDPSRFPASSKALSLFPSTESKAPALLRQTSILARPFPESFLRLQNCVFSVGETDLFIQTKTEALAFLEKEWKEVSQVFFTFVHTIERAYKTSSEFLPPPSGGFRAASEREEPSLKLTPRERFSALKPSSRASSLDFASFLLEKRSEQKLRLTQALMAGAFKSRLIFFAFLVWKQGLDPNQKQYCNEVLREVSFLPYLGWKETTFIPGASVKGSFYSSLIQQTVTLTLEALAIPKPSPFLETFLTNHFQANLEEGWEAFHEKEKLRSFLHFFFAQEERALFLEQDFTSPFFNEIRFFLESLQIYQRVENVPEEARENVFWMIVDRERAFDDTMIPKGLLRFSKEVLEGLCRYGVVSVQEEKEEKPNRIFFRREAFAFLVFGSSLPKEKKSLFPLKNEKVGSFLLEKMREGRGFLYESLQLLEKYQKLLQERGVPPEKVFRAIFSRENHALLKETDFNVLHREILRLLLLKAKKSKGEENPFAAIEEEEDYLLALLLWENGQRNFYYQFYRILEAVLFLKLTKEQVVDFERINPMQSFCQPTICTKISSIHADVHQFLQEISGLESDLNKSRFPLKSLLFTPPISLEKHPTVLHNRQKKLKAFSEIQPYLKGFTPEDYTQDEFLLLIRRVLAEEIDPKVFSFFDPFLSQEWFTGKKMVHFLLELPTLSVSERAEAFFCWEVFQKKGFSKTTLFREEMFSFVTSMLKGEIAPSHFWLFSQLPEFVQLSEEEQTSFLTKISRLNTAYPSFLAVGWAIKEKLASSMRRELIFLEKTYKDHLTGWQYAELFYEWFYLFLKGEVESLGEAKCFLEDLQRQVGIFPAKFAYMFLRGFPKVAKEERKQLSNSFRELMKLANHPELETERFLLNPSQVNQLYQAINSFCQQFIDTGVLELCNLYATLNYALRAVILPSAPQFITDLMKLVGWKEEEGPIYLEEQVNTHEGVTNFPMGNQKEVLALGSSAEWVEEGDHLALRISYSMGGNSESLSINLGIPLQVWVEQRFTLLRLLSPLLQEEVPKDRINWLSYKTQWDKFAANPREQLRLERKIARQCFDQPGIILRLYEYGLFQDPYYFLKGWEKILLALDQAKTQIPASSKEFWSCLRGKVANIRDALPSMHHTRLKKDLEELQEIKEQSSFSLINPYLGTNWQASFSQQLDQAMFHLQNYLQGNWMGLKDLQKEIIFKVIEKALAEDSIRSPKFTEKEIKELNTLLEQRAKSFPVPEDNYATVALHFMKELKTCHRRLLRKSRSKINPEETSLRARLINNQQIVHPDGVPCLLSPFTAYDREYFSPLNSKEFEKPLRDRIIEVRKILQKETSKTSFPYPLEVFLREDHILSLAVSYQVEALKGEEKGEITGKDSLKITLEVKAGKKPIQEVLIFPYSCFEKGKEEAFLNLYAKLSLTLLSRVRASFSSRRFLQEEEKI